MHFAYLLLALPYLCLAAPITDYASIDARSPGCREIDGPECGGHQAYKREVLDAPGRRDVDENGHQAYKREELVTRATTCSRDINSRQCGGHQAYKREELIARGCCAFD